MSFPFLGLKHLSTEFTLVPLGILFPLNIPTLFSDTWKQCLNSLNTPAMQENAFFVPKSVQYALLFVML